MGQRSIDFCFLLLWGSTLLSLVGAKVHFYSREGDLLGDIIPTANCQRLPSKAFDSTDSIQADRCVMIFTDTSCLYGYSIKINPNSTEPNTENGESLFPHYHVKAIRLCNENESLSRLQVELFKEATPHDRLEVFGPVRTQAPQRVAEYSVKTCVNIDAPLIGNIGSLSNSGTCIRLFAKENCEGRSYDLRGGSTVCSNNLASCGYTKLASLQPCIASYKNFPTSISPTNIFWFVGFYKGKSDKFTNFADSHYFINA